MAVDDHLARRKALLCFHGTGSKGSIFNIQMARICWQLRDDFEFIFLDGPRDGAAGPGVLPMFSGQEPFKSWFGDDMSIDDSIRVINGAIKAGIAHWRASHPDIDIEIVGGIGFSEGGLALALMLWLQQEQQQRKIEGPSCLLSALPRIHFAVISCCFFPREASLWANARASAAGLQSAMIDVPTLHIHGKRDFSLGRARQLVRNHYRPPFASVIQVDTGHHMPNQKQDVDEVVRQIRTLPIEQDRKDIGCS